MLEPVPPEAAAEPPSLNLWLRRLDVADAQYSAVRVVSSLTVDALKSQWLAARRLDHHDPACIRLHLCDCGAGSPSVSDETAALANSPLDARARLCDTGLMDGCSLLVQFPALSQSSSSALHASVATLAARLSQTAVARSAGFDSLPLALQLAVWALLPVDARARCACVSRAWRAALDDPVVWRELDLSRGAGAPSRALTPAFLLAACARALGGLVSLDLWGASLRLDELQVAVRANAASLRRLRVSALLDGGSLERKAAPRLLLFEEAASLCAAAPALECFETALTVNVSDVNVREFTGGGLPEEALAMAPPFAALRVLQLDAWGWWQLPPDTVALFLQRVSRHAPLRSLGLSQAPLGDPAALAAVVTAAERMRLAELRLHGCQLSPASLPELTRLLRRCGSLRRLHVSGEPGLLCGEHSPPFCDALRAAPLAELGLSGCGLWACAEGAAGASALCAALTGHASLAALDLSENGRGADAQAAAAAGVSLAALVAANAPALRSLRLAGAGCELRLLLAALGCARHLRALDVRGCAPLRAADAHAMLLPALAANASLRSLRLREGADGAASSDFADWSGSGSPPASPQGGLSSRAEAEERAAEELLLQAERMVSDRS